MPQQKGFKRAQKVAKRKSKIAASKKAANIRRTERRKTHPEKEEAAAK